MAAEQPGARSRRGLQRGERRRLGDRDQTLQEVLRALRDPLALDRAGRARRPAADIEQRVELLGAQRGRQVLLVVLQHDRRLLGLAERAQVLEHLVHRRDILVERFAAAVGDEDDAVGAGQQQLAGGRVVVLPRDRVVGDAQAVPLHGAELVGQALEAERALRVHVLVLQLAGAAGRRPVLQAGEVGRFAGESRSVVDDLDDQFTGGRIEQHADRRLQWWMARSGARAAGARRGSASTRSRW